MDRDESGFLPRLPVKPMGPKGIHCLLCGRKLRQSGAWVSMVHLMSDQTLADPLDADLFDSWESHGCFPVGPECRFKVAGYTFQIESDQVFSNLFTN